VRATESTISIFMCPIQQQTNASVNYFESLVSLLSILSITHPLYVFPLFHAPRDSSEKVLQINW
jgi:hypothetical protein